jgi:MFS transporter, DHA1 family, tetracycline resistance protein
MAKKRNSALIFIFITMLIDVIGIGIIIPGLPDLLKSLGEGTLSDAAEEGGILMSAYAIMQFFFSPIMGGISDRYGRRPVILGSLLGLGLDFLVTAFAPTIAWLFLGRIIAGIFGASFSTAGAYIADVSEPEKRAQNFGLIGAAFGLGFILGPMIGGLLIPYGVKMPFFVAAGLSLANLIFGFFVLPESLKPENRREFDWKRANPLGTLKQMFKHKIVAELMPPFILIMIAGYASQSTWAYFTREQFGWDGKMVGYSLAVVGLSTALVQGFLTRKAIPALGMNKSIYYGLAVYAVGFVLYALASEGWMMFAFTAVASLGGISMPAMQGLMSNAVPPNEQGELRGGMTSLMSVTAIVGPLLMSYLFAYFTAKTTSIYLPAAPFWMAALLTVISLIWIYQVLSKQK